MSSTNGLLQWTNVLEAMHVILSINKCFNDVILSTAELI